MGSEPQDTCRLCAGTFLSVVPIFGNDDLPMKIQNICSLEVKSNDGLPAQICHQCAQLVNLFYHFKLRCESSDCFFRLGNASFKSESSENQLEDMPEEPAIKIDRETESTQNEEQVVSDPTDKTDIETECTQNGTQFDSENDEEEEWISDLTYGDEATVLEKNGERCQSIKPAIPEYLKEPYMRVKPGKKPNFPVEVVAQLLQQYREALLTKDGKLQPKAAPCWQFICEVLNNMLEGIYNTTTNNIYTYVKCNRYNLQSYLSLGTEGKHKQSVGTNKNSKKDDSEGDSDKAKNNDHDYHIQEDVESKTVKFVVTLSKEEWLGMSLELVYGEPFLNRHGWSHINRLFKATTEAKCRMLYSSIVEAGEEGAFLSLHGKCHFCDSTFTGYINGKDLLPDQPVQILCMYIGTFQQPHPRSNEQRQLYNSGEELKSEPV